ncbi:MAG TPA: T9SS type A sorting domain-containing protein, partial [Chitinophagales bacterium]|nr:T9SS type A sorting domain-containing protein [Chitinophagales bacterium]
VNTAFGIDGNVSLESASYGFPNGSPPHAAALANGKFVVLVRNQDVEANYVVRFHANGVVDSSFGTNGWVMDGNDETLQSYGVYTDSASNIYTLTTLDEDFPFTYRIRKYLPGGAVATSFGNAGNATLPVNHQTNRLAVQNDGKIIVAGFAGPSFNDYSAFIGRLKDDGAADSSFATFGFDVLELSGYSTAHRALALSANKIYTAGFIQSSFVDRRGMVARYLNDGNVAVATLHTGERVRVYPNPTNHSLTVKPESRVNETLTVRICNLLGQVVYESELDQSNESGLTVTVAGWSSGVYNVMLNGQAHSASTRVVKH